jgi:radical SAM protein with 4Fe4S-binding SPASM domain
VDQIRLLGGEPTLHPEFEGLLALALERGKPIRIFSNGSMPERVLAFIERLAEDRVGFVVNLSASLHLPGGIPEDVRRALQRLAGRAVLGINVSRPSGDFAPPGVSDGIGYLFDLVESHRLRRELRIGLAHPCVGFENSYLHPNQYYAAGRTIFELAQRAVARRIALTLDCGLVPCMAPELLDSRFGEASRQLRGQCGPVLDILVDGRVIPCFPLARVLSETLASDADAGSLRRQMEKRLAGYREFGVFKSCARCDFRRRRLCSGGCLAAALRRLRSPEFALRV